MSETVPSVSPAPRRAWAVALLVAGALFAWNGSAAWYASPFTLLHTYDGAQYHLLVRNRLRGHYEVGDEAHTVRTEGTHPIWRPGLVLIEEGLARLLGSVASAAAFASALGTTLLELAMLALAWRHFGRVTAALLLALLVLRNPCAALFLQMAVGQGPEPWAAAAVVAGLGLLLEAVRRGSWRWAVAAGAVAGAAECFRTGNFLLFLVPCAILALSSLVRTGWRAALPPTAAVLGYAVAVFLAGQLVPSTVNKVAVNFWHRLLECRGPEQPHYFPDVGVVSISAGNLNLAPDGSEAYCDHAVRVSRGGSGVRYFWDHRNEILHVYTSGLAAVRDGWASGLRAQMGSFVIVLVLVEVVLSLFRRTIAERAALALALGGLAHYLGPLVLLRGDNANQYLCVAAPLFYLVAARAIVCCSEVLNGWFGSRETASPDSTWRPRPILVAVGLATLLAVNGLFYWNLVGDWRAKAQQAVEEHTALDRLPLHGKRVAIRNMSWFFDRDTVTVMLPYATVPELERYARAQRLDGLLYWEHEPQYCWRMLPSDVADTDPALGERERAVRDRDAFEEQLRASRVFGPPVVSDGWRWYPVQRP